jgi:hypothetical protein
VRLAGLILLLSDATLAVLIWLAAYELRSIWGWYIVLWWEDAPPRTAMVIGAFAVSVWLGIRSLMGLYPGYSLSSAEWLRRHRYSVVGACVAAVYFIIVLGLHGDFFPRLLVLSFVGVLLLSPLVQSLARRGMERLGIWDSPVNDGPR